jgi:hypothetical protein
VGNTELEHLERHAGALLTGGGQGLWVVLGELLVYAPLGLTQLAQSAARSSASSSSAKKSLSSPSFRSSRWRGLSEVSHSRRARSPSEVSS